jgi:hypothetical protein
MLGSRDELYNASQGRMPSRVTATPSPVIQPYSGNPINATNLATAQLATNGPTNTYGRIVSSPATGGLSAGGKYGGFFSASDEQAAIEGSARNLRENVAPTLQAKAQAFYNKLDPMYAEVAGSPERYFQAQRGGYNSAQMPSVNPNMKTVTPGGYIDKIVNPSRQYANQLSDWYSSQSKPAQEYNATALQIQNTPLSQLASQIATTGYGMNPDLATAKFAGLDTQYYNEQENAKSMAEHGMPAAQWKASQAENDKAIAALPQQYQTALQDKVGYKASALESITGQTSQQLYSYLSPQYSIKDPDTNSNVVLNGATVVDKMRKYISAGDDKSAQAIINGLVADPTPGNQDLVRILNAMYKLGRVNQKKLSDTASITMAP